ncbi:GntP family permease [Nesterenkonia alkaliphila]|uniref:Gluconate transporter n=1 Tax=Nesterenkonia alkaliphila TaxID=1463631 RepID=A0A7K1UMV2_9MICC|nr:gluconate:H+ symporter [Nesterenkonia alkaliphila]MVT27351.1 gluconate transporter [Nesterenkonia alkaliphila]GFZ80652.1 gluconate transporter [Nesterenkonia alkaliphila]
MSTIGLLLSIVGAVVVLFLLIMGLKLHAFVALLVTSILTAVVVGVPLGDVIEVVEEGMGGVLGFVAIIVGLGAMFGQVLRVTGAAEKIADTLVESFGEKRLPSSLGLTGFIVAIPVFFDVVLVLLMPLLYTLARRAEVALLTLAIPLLAGASIAHSLVPPTPGPVAAAGVLGADLGWVILLGIVASIPAVILGGVLYGKFIGARIQVGAPDEGDSDDEEEDQPSSDSTPSFGMILSILAVPLLLILGNTVAEAVMDEDQLVAQIIALVGDPIVALIIGVLLAFYVLGMRHGLGREELQTVASKALEPVGLIILVTGAGGVFGEVLEQSGVGEALENTLGDLGIPVILTAFVAAALLRVSLGASTVATVTAAAIVAPMVEGGDFSPAMIGAIVVAVGAGSVIFSHVNDSGFWLVNRYLGLTEKQTLASWSVMQTILSVVAFGTVWAMTPLL